MDEVTMSTKRLNATLAGFAAITVTAGFLAVRTFPLAAAQESPRQEAQSASKPRAIYKAPIEYPEAMRGSGLEASVDLKIQIDKEGKVAEAVADPWPCRISRGGPGVHPAMALPGGQLGSRAS